MARIRQEDIEAVKERTDIVKLVGQYLTLKKSGHDSLTGLCPFHQEKTGSFSVSPAKQVFYCFGCGKGGDAITFLRELEQRQLCRGDRATGRRRRGDAALSRATPRRSGGPPNDGRRSTGRTSRRRSCSRRCCSDGREGERRTGVHRRTRHRARGHRVVPDRLCARLLGFPVAAVGRCARSVLRHLARGRARDDGR